MTRPAPSPRAPRSRVLVILDVVAGVIVALVGLVLGLVLLAFENQLAHANDGVCTSGPYSGLECDANALGLTVTVMTILTVLVWALTTGMLLVRLVQRRWGFYFPVIGFVLLLVVLYAGSAFAGQIVEHA